MKCLIVLFCVKVLVVLAEKEVCDECIPKEQCPAFANMDIHEQESWMKKFPCDGPPNDSISIFGFATIAKGDKVCCPSSQGEGINKFGQNIKKNSNSTALEPEYQGIYPQSNRRNPYLFGNQNPNVFGNQGYNPNGYGGQNYPNQNLYGQQNSPANRNIFGRQQPNQGIYGQQNYPNNQGYFGNGQNQPGNQNMFGGQQTLPGNQGYPGNQNLFGQQTVPANQGFPGNQNLYGGQQNHPTGQGFLGNNQNTPGNQYTGQQYVPGQNNINGEQRPDNTNLYGAYPNQNIGNQFNKPINQNIYNNPLNFNRPSTPSPWGSQNIPGYQNNPQINNPNQVMPGIVSPSTPSTLYQNPYYQGNTPHQNQNNYGNDDGDENDKILSKQCKRMKTSYPPSPETGCCGKDMSDSERVTDLQNLLNIFAPAGNQNAWNSPNRRWPSYQRRKRSLKNVTTDVTLDDRIAGGRETELDQFPWTVLLKTTFDYGDKTAAFSCGGSLISRRYVLTAGHCVYEPKARISDVEVTLAEYDKRTFPLDCITVFGGGRECVKNVVMHAEDVVHHPEYDDDRLINDIALIRLNTFAPYTRYIRPVCLPSINIDIPEFSNLPLAVAGWGRDGQYVTDVKQSTVVQLVPPDDCEKSYPHLTKSHLCAAGRTGQDTCKGDSGGPLMMLYKDSYYIIGVVSGKRADSPCGSKVPSLYTNVYQFVDWIHNTIRE